jgi:hypothetical protein
MHSEGLNTLFIAVPLLVVLVAGVLRVDEHMFTSETRNKASAKRRTFAVVDQDGEVVLTDPDGRAFSGKSGRSR